MRKLLVAGLLASSLVALGQDDEISNTERDSIYIAEIEQRSEKPKVLHAEPLYIDLIRDLGARKGEKEWNIGMGMQDNLSYDSYEALIEYEFAPIDRLGLEIEIPFTFYSPHRGVFRDSVPSDRMESLKLAAQWTFLVSEKHATSLALGYINEFEFSDLKRFGSPLFIGNVYNPFFIAAKRWGNNFHTLLYTGPVVHHHFSTQHVHVGFEINSNVHYMIKGTRNFIGLEVNKYIEDNDFFMTLRPQMRLGISDDFMIGIVTGIPLKKEGERFSTFFRVIWEPGHHHKDVHHRTSRRTKHS